MCDKPIEIYHKNLKPVSTDSDYKSYCPFCPQGTLKLRRNEDFSLSNLDNYISCGIAVKYLDIGN